MTIVVDATYEDGVLRPQQPLPFQNSEKVRIVVCSQSEALRDRESVGAVGARREALARLLSLQLPVADWDQMEDEISEGAIGK